MPIEKLTTNSIESNAITTDKIAAGAVVNADISDGVITGAKLADTTVTAAKLHTTAVTDKLGYTPANAANLTNVENKSSATIRGEISSSNVTTALGYTPVNKAGDTMTGNLIVDGFSGGKGLAFRSGFEDTDNHKIYAGAVDVPGRNGGIRISGYDGVAISTGDNTFTTRLKVDMGGRVTMPYQPAFIAYGNSSNLTLIGNQRTVIPYNIEHYDRAGNYNPSTARFTAPVSGLYFFYASYLKYPNSLSANMYISFAITKNGASPYTEAGSSLSRWDSAIAQTTHDVTQIFNLAAGDYVEAAVLATNDTSIYTQAGHAVFFGYLIG